MITRICAALAIATVGVAPAAAAEPAGTEIIDVPAIASHPETVSGAWEMATESGEIVGLSIQINGSIDGDATTLLGQPVQADALRLRAYVRRGDDLRTTYWTPASPGALTWRGDRLRLRPSPALRAGLDLDVRFDPASSTWTGTLRDPDFSGTVTLTRPDGVLALAPVGTWLASGPQSADLSCLHLATGHDTRLVAWHDSITFGGRITGPPGTARPSRSLAIFGAYDEPALMEQTEEGWRFRVGDELSGDTYDGALSDDGTAFSGTRRHDGNGVNDGADNPFTWQRESGDSCA